MWCRPQRRSASIVLLSGQPGFVQPDRVGLSERVTGGLGQGRSAPQAECLAQPGGRDAPPPGQIGARRACQALEPDRVELIGLDTEPVTGWLGDQRPRGGPEDPPQP